MTPGQRQLLALLGVFAASAAVWVGIAYLVLWGLG